MRRLLVGIPLVVIAVVMLGGLPAHAASAHAASRRGHDPMIVCPLPTDVVGPPCCGPPVNSPDTAAAATTCCPTAASPQIEPICCGTAAPCSVSVSASPNPATEGQQVTLSGSVLGGTASGATLELWQKAAGDATFTQVGTTTTGAAAGYSMTAPGTVQTNRQWYVTDGALQSATISEQVSADVTLLVARGRHSSTVHGAVTPSHAGERVLLQRSLRGKWVTIARPRLNHKSKFSVRYAPPPHVKATLRAVLASDSKNMRSVSSSVTAGVFPRVTAK